MHLFYIPDISSEIQLLPPEESAHCIKVLRLQKGDTVYLTDGIGGLYQTTIIDDHAKRCILQIIESKKEEEKKEFKIHLAVAPTKNINRFEWFLEKATEIGMDKITPLLCAHSERKIIKPERLNKVITAAMKQSLKAYHPKLNEMISFKKFIQTAAADQKFIAYCSETYTDHLKDKSTKGKNVIVLIGPEGDFSPAEVKVAIENGYHPVNLGPSRLRTETAAVVACHTVNLVNL
ncbi:MAG: 16S rRNA (uracil(1498)-N(3))-methyltransferase [Bacteroidales bacterium]|nr:16S rRNA (uracil(1498)-N(3))-methyltransferase [Bacteroidales bacterium]